MRTASPAIPPTVPPVMAATFFLEEDVVVGVAGPADWAVEVGDTWPVTGTVWLGVVDKDFELDIEEEDFGDEEVDVELLELEVVLVGGADVGVKFTPV